MHDEKFQKLALSLVPGVGGKTFKNLLIHFGKIDEVFSANKSRLLKVKGVGEKAANFIYQKSTFNQAEKIISDCQKQAINIVIYDEEEFPSRLRNIPETPCVLYSKGNLELNPPRAISIIGTRKASAYGRDVTEHIVTELKSYNPLIVSGLAYGIDIASHKFSLEHSLPTIGVLAGGLDKIYPSEHIPIAKRMQENGGIISEHPPGVIPEAPKFPARNRIIAGLSQAIIVVEAASSGGALITAEFANTYNRDVFAVPGKLNAYSSQGCHKLIKEHKANIFTSVEDLVYYLNWDISTKRVFEQIEEIEGLDKNERTVFEELKQNKSLLLEELSWNTQIPMTKLVTVLLEMEFKGFICALPGKKYALKEIFI